MRMRSISSLFALLLVAGLTSALGGPPNDDPIAKSHSASATICVEYLTGTVICGPSAPTPNPPPCENGTAVLNPKDNPELVSDCAILLDVKATLAGDATLNWDADTPITEWDGVTINETLGRVRELWLESRGLTGSIPPELAGLSLLRGLRLTDNHLTGPIPWRLWSMTSLSELRLAGNTGLTGCIPPLSPWSPSHDLAALGLPDCSRTQLCENGIAVANPQDNPGLVADCVNLLEVKAEVYLKYRLNWDTHVSLAEWEGITIDGTPARVRGMEVRGRGVTGRLSPQLGELSELRTLRLSINRLHGPIPAELGNLRHLQTLDLGSNDLTGAIPAELGSLRNLSSLHLSENQLTGSIPVEFGALRGLQSLHLDSNQVSGTIPAALGSLSNLETLWLSDNQFSGAIPREIGALGALETLALDYNRLTGTIPTELGSLHRLRILHLSGNDLAGAIPAELGALLSLRTLALQENRLRGAIPATLGSLRNLRHLWLHDNQLTGAIPVALGKLYNLESLWLHENQLTGGVPAELGSLHALETLRLDGNQLSGAIPPALGALGRLAFLYLHDNHLSGAIPSELGALRNLGFLRLHYNELSGAIPRELGILPHLRHVYLGGNAGLTGCLAPALRDLPDNDLAALGLADCAPEMVHPPIEPPARQATVLPYNRLDTTGSATTPGSYAFLDGAANMISTYEGLREDAVELRIHQADADGMSRADAYGTVAPGDVVEWRQGDDCWVRYEVTALLPDPPGTEPRRHFAVKWMAHAGTGCAGPINTASPASVTLHPPDLLTATITSPVRFGPYIIEPLGWIGDFDDYARVIPRPGGSLRPVTPPEGVVWGSDDDGIDVARQHPLWPEPALPLAWVARGARTYESAIDIGYGGREGGGSARLWITWRDLQPRRVEAWGSSPNHSEEIRTIDGHVAFLRTGPVVLAVHIVDEATGIGYFVHVYHTDSPDSPGMDDAIAFARSLYH